MKVWMQPLTITPIAEVLEAVNDIWWQHFRRSLKGKSTEQKLDELYRYGVSNLVLIGDKLVLPRVYQVRIDNYIKALLRGGQLIHKDGHIEVQR